MKLHSSIPAFSFFLYMLFSHIAANLNSDRQALLDFAATVPHVRKVNWNAAAPICTSWVGIACNLNKTRVIAIHLPGVGLSGPIPANSIGKLDALKILSLRSNYLSGDLPSDVPSIPSLVYLNLQHNNFSGDFPTNLSPHLSVLDLSFNSFCGNIPPTIQNLTRLAELNLQNNSLSGAIPSLKLPKLSFLNLSYNKLNGSVPSSLQSFPYSSFVGNSMLCGQPLKNCSTDTILSSPSPSPTYFSPQKTSRKLGPGSIVAIVIGASAVLSLLILMLTVFCLKRSDSTSRGVLKGKAYDIGGKAVEPNKDFGSGVQEAEKNKLFFFEGCSYSFDLEDLLRASAEVLGKGSYGTAYRAALEDGTTVVVKRLKEVVAGKKEFEQQMEVVGRLGQHPNVVPIRAYYFSKDEKLLVYNYMPTGSLCTLLHGNKDSEGRSPLDWDSRVKISLGTAKGIAHIHSEGGTGTNKPSMCHGNIKSSNVLLTQDLTGCISDVGLAPLMNFPTPTMTRAAGYRAPEMVETRKATQKSDVYSFGVLLLEMLTGKAPVQYPGQQHHDGHLMDLPRWVRSVVREEWTGEVFDVELMRYQNVEEEMVQMLQIALACVSKLPEVRPGMDQVVAMIEEIQQKNRPSSDESEQQVVSS